MRLRLGALVVVLGCLCAPARAETADSPLDRVIDRAGLQGKLVQLDAMMQRGTDELQKRQPRYADFFERTRRAHALTYAPSRLRQILKAQLEGRLSRADLDAVLAQSDSPSEHRLAAIAKRAQAPAERARIDAALQGGERPALAPRRSELLHELVRATRMDELSAALLIAAAVGSAEGYAHGGAESSQATVRQMRQGIDSERASLVAAMREDVVAFYALIYTEATDADLEDALRFARSPAGARFYRVSAQAFEATAEQAARDFAIEMSRTAAPAASSR